MKTFLSVIVLLIAVPAFSQIGAKAQQGKLQGTWHNNLAGYQMTLLLNADGTGELDGEALKYSVKDNKFTVTVVSEGETLVYNYVLQGNSLTLSGGDMEGPMTFIRSGTTSDQPVTNTPSATPTTKAPGDKSLIGLWSGNNETIEFTASGQCNYQGQSYAYQVSAGQVTLQTSQGNFTMGYVVQGNQLSLTVNGQTIQYSKGNANQNTTPPTTGGRRVAQELVGKWCYVNVNSTNSGGSSTEECITLKADGTYEYYSESSRSVNTNTYSGGTNAQSGDRGTWSYDGSRIYYTSTAGAGSGSYGLEKRNHPKNNDPMIVLDGKTFVTFYQKAPWR